MTTIKICGITRAEDAELAVGLGAHALGFVLWPRSPRCISVADAARIVRTLSPLVTSVGVFVDPTRDELVCAVEEGGFSAIQVHGDMARWDVIRSVSSHLIRAVRLGGGRDGIEPDVDEATTVLLDAHDPVRMGGTGQVIDWTRAAAVAARRRLILAGGLTPTNVADAIRAVRPYGVDVASGVEARPGIKDPVKLRAFVEAARGASSTEGTPSGDQDVRKAPL
jgi:phosphoribosylanthranilate isomerase